MMTNTAVIIRTDLSFQNAMLCRRPITHTSEQYLLVPIPKISYLLSIIKTEMTLNWKINGSAEVYYHNFHCNLRFSSHAKSHRYTTKFVSTSDCFMVKRYQGHPIRQRKPAPDSISTIVIGKQGKLPEGFGKKIVFALKVSDDETLSVRGSFIELVNVFSCWNICFSCVVILHG